MKCAEKYSSVSGIRLVPTLLHFSLQLAVQSDHHRIVFSICVALARASSNSLCIISCTWRENISIIMVAPTVCTFLLHFFLLTCSFPV